MCLKWMWKKSHVNVVSNECGLKWKSLKWMWSQINVVSNEQVSKERGLKRTWSQKKWSQMKWSQMKRSHMKRCQMNRSQMNRSQMNRSQMNRSQMSWSQMSWSQMNAVSNERSQMNDLKWIGLNSHGTVSVSCRSRLFLPEIEQMKYVDQASFFPFCLIVLTK